MATPRLLERLCSRLELHGRTREQFIDALTTPAPQESALVWRSRPSEIPQLCHREHTLLPNFITIANVDTRPGKMAAHAAGDFYVLDLSSAVVGAALASLTLRHPIVLDVCAAPGGKSVMAWRALQPSLLISNETIANRSASLISNIQRMQLQPCIVTRMDPALLPKAFEYAVDLAIVDAPCSGQSLLARGHRADGCFHPLVISRNAKRQRRILAESSHCISPGGYLLYSTCTFSQEENEENVLWFLQHFEEFSAVSISPLAELQSAYTEVPCYRLWPTTGLGAGGFFAVLQRRADFTRAQPKLEAARILWRSNESSPPSRIPA